MPLLDQHIDLCQLEAGVGELEQFVDQRQLLELESEDLFVPLRKLSQAVVGEHEAAPLCLAQMFDRDGGDRGQADLNRGKYPAMAARI